MAFYGDARRLDAAVAAVEEKADDIRSLAAAMRDRTTTMAWQSAKADRYRAEIDNDVSKLNAVAAALDTAAARMRDHAATVRERLDAIAHFERAAHQYFQTVTSELQRAAAAAVSAVEHPITTLEHTLEHPPWEHWVWQPHNLPPSGEKSWLDAGAYLRRMGAI